MLKLLAATVAAVAIAAGSSFAGGDPFERVWVDSLKETAHGTGGRTAHKEYRVTAGPDRAFVPDSLRFIENSRSGGGRVEARFLKEKFIYVDVPVTIDGVTYTLRMPQTVVISMYAETGSSPRNYNRGAWINGWVDGETVEISR